MADTKAAVASTAAKASSPAASKSPAAPKKGADAKTGAPPAKDGKRVKHKRVRKPPQKLNDKGKKLKSYQISQGRPKNYALSSGLMAYSKSQMFHKKGKWKCISKTSPKKARAKKPFMIEKPIGGEKNGATRKVLVQRRRKDYPLAELKKRPRGNTPFVRKVPRLRKSLKPGTIAILVAGPHKGKRVVVLKLLRSGLLLVNGPFKINGCPLRRVSPNYVIATSTRVNFSGIQIPKHLKDDYFKRARAKKTKKEEGDIFSTKKEKYTPSEQRKKDQKLVDDLTIKALSKSKEKKLLFRYMASMFSLKNNQYPHRMKF